MATIVNMFVDQGSTYEHKFSYREADGTTVIPLTSYTARAHVRESIDDDVTVFTGTDGTGEITIDGPNGDVTMVIPNSITETWDFNSAVYDLEVVSPTGEVTRIVQGEVIVDPEVTR